MRAVSLAQQDIVPATRTLSGRSAKTTGPVENPSFAATYLLESRELCVRDPTRLDFSNSPDRF